MSYANAAQLRQSALKAAAEIVSALVNVKVIKTEDEAMKVLATIRTEAFDDLKAVADSEPKQQSSGGGGSRFPKADPAEKLAEALATEMNSGKFKGQTIGNIFKFDGPQAEAFGYGKGDKTGRDYAAFMAGDGNPNQYTRRRFALVVEAAKNGDLPSEAEGVEPQGEPSTGSSDVTTEWGV